MKKRLKKKKHIGEFKVFGVSLDIKRKTKFDCDSFLDAFIDEAIEANNCFCGGGGQENKLSFFIELGRKCNEPEKVLDKIRFWMNSRSDIDEYNFGRIIDANYGPFSYLYDISEKI